MKPTAVYDSYWRFAAERLSVYYRKQRCEDGPWTEDPILEAFRFTNTYRAADRVSQYLIREIQYNSNRSCEPTDVVFRTLLFKIFNKIETWEAVEAAIGPIEWRPRILEQIERVLDRRMREGHRIYSAAYIMPAPRLGAVRKHSNHLALLANMLKDRLPDRVCQAPNLSAVYELLLRYPGLGSFLAFQYAIDLNYSVYLNFPEDEFVIAGPGAIDGISKCFSDFERYSPEDVIYHMMQRQEYEFKRLDISFPGLYGRPLQPIDCQNLFCEISKYARVAHPEISGVANRHRIKQMYKRSSRAAPVPMFPPKWALKVGKHERLGRTRQLALL
ncbi:MAG: nucleotide kinase domain-containing protein [Pseudomonadota bacterium]